MARSIDDTLTPRNGANFPVVDGPVKVRSIPKASFPNPGVFPPGTHLTASDENYRLYSNTDGTAWMAQASSTALTSLFSLPTAKVNPPMAGGKAGAELIRRKCSPTGNDTTGDGTDATPYLTPERAALDCPALLQGRSFRIDMTGSNTIDGASSLVLSTARAHVTLYSDGVSDWMVG